MTFFLMGFMLATMYYDAVFFTHLLTPVYEIPLQTIQDVLDSKYNVRLVQLLHKYAMKLLCILLQVFSLTGMLQQGLSEDSDPKLLQLAQKSFKHGDIFQALTNVSNRKVVLTESEQMAKYRINLDFLDR